MTRVVTCIALLAASASTLYILLALCRRRSEGRVRREVEDHSFGVFVPATSDAEAAEIVAVHPAFRPKIRTH